MGPLDAARALRSAGGALWAQALLHGELAQVEWAQERQRLLRLLAMGVLGFAFFLCALLTASALALAAAWDTAYRLPALLLLLLAHGLATAMAWRRLRALSAQGGTAFAASRAEFAADGALLRNANDRGH